MAASQRPAFAGGTMVRRTSSRSARQARLNASNGSGSRLSDNAALASCPTSTPGLSEISMIALSTASAASTMSGGARASSGAEGR